MEGVIILFTLIVLLFSIIIHEIAHGSIAYYLGDPTAKHAGRLTLNPLKHLDPFGSVVLPLFLAITGSPFLIGWAKPVPINPYNFRNQRWDNAKVAISGPCINIFVALIFGISSRFLPLEDMMKSAITTAFLTGNSTALNLLIQDSIIAKVFFAFSVIVILNLLLAIFNLIPIPPLDGSHILFSLLSEKYRKVKLFLQQYGLFILLLFIFFGFQYIYPLILLAYYLIAGHLPVFL